MQIRIPSHARKSVRELSELEKETNLIVEDLIGSWSLITSIEQHAEVVIRRNLVPMSANRSSTAQATQLTFSFQKNSNLGLLFSLSLRTCSNSFPCSCIFLATVDKKFSSSSVSSFGQIRRGGERDRDAEVDRRRFEDVGWSLCREVDARGEDGSEGERDRRRRWLPLPAPSISIIGTADQTSTPRQRGKSDEP